jgi:hypothetical protein
MMLIRLCLILGLMAALPAVSQVTSVAVCPSAAPGTTWSATNFLPCASTVTYASVPLAMTAIVSDMNCSTTPCTFTWQKLSSVPLTDQTWVKTTAIPAGTWVQAGTIATTTPPLVNASVTVSWSPVTTDTTGKALTCAVTYNVYQGLSATSLPTVTPIAIGTSVILTTGLTIGVANYFTVTAVCGNVESAQPTPVSLVIASAAPATPTKVQATQT